MSLIFFKIDDVNIEKVRQWRNEIDTQIIALGGIYSNDDYGKITPIITRYMSQFKSTSAELVALEYPRLKVGTILVKQK